MTMSLCCCERLGAGSVSSVIVNAKSVHLAASTLFQSYGMFISVCVRNKRLINSLSGLLHLLIDKCTKTVYTLSCTKKFDTEVVYGLMEQWSAFARAIS